MRVSSIKDVAMIHTIYSFNYETNNLFKKLKKQKSNHNRNKKFKLSPKEKEILNKKIIDIKKLYDIEARRARNTRVYNQLNNHGYYNYTSNNMQNKKRVMNEYSQSGVIDFQSRNEVIKRKRNIIKNNTIKEVKKEKKIEHKNVQNNNIQNKKSENELREKNFREIIMEGKKTPKEYAYERAWKEFEKALKENRLMENNKIRRCRYGNRQYYTGKKINKRINNQYER